MTDSIFFRRRISKEIRRFVFPVLVLVPLLSAFSADRVPVTVEGRINRNAFPATRLAEQYTTLPEGAEEALREKMDDVLKPITLAPASWFRASFGTVPSLGDRKRILESLGETEIWMCKGECSGCSGSPAGCVLSRRVSGGNGVVAAIHPCLLGEAKCRSGIEKSAAAWAERIVTEVAFYKSAPVTTYDAKKAAVKNSLAWIRNTSKSVNDLLGACPGPYSASASKFLHEVDALTEPNSALKKCGNAYVNRGAALPTKCTGLIAKWDRSERAETLRCDSFCRKMLCRTANTKTTLVQIGGKKTLLLLDGACEGAEPLDVPGFLRDLFPASTRNAAESLGCFPKAKASTAPSTEDSGISGLGNGKEVQLVD